MACSPRAMKITMQPLIGADKIRFGAAWWMMILLVATVFAGGHLLGNELYQAWQKDKAYTLAGYGTQDYGGGGKLAIEYVRNNRLNTAEECSP